MLLLPFVGSYDVIFEPWFVTVELGFRLGLYETKTILIPKDKVLNLSKNLGVSRDQAQITITRSVDYIIKPSPCCGDVMFLLPFRNKTSRSVGGERTKHFN